MLPAHAVCWTELPVTDLDRSRKFYGAILNAPLTEMAMGPDMTYVFPNADVKAGVSGHIYKGKPAPKGTGPTVHLVVPDTVEAALDRVKHAGGEVVSAAIAIPAGRFAYCLDPDGNSFGVFEYAR
jgi:hypothetical protein